MPNPSIHVSEFASRPPAGTDPDDILLTTREHPDFGTWEHRSMNLGFAIVNEHRTEFSRPVGIQIEDDNMMKQVHHCMCMNGSTGAHFSDYKLTADLPTGSYHMLAIQAREYLHVMTPKFYNVHIQISRDYYTDLLSDDERWSADLKEKIYSDDVCFPGTFSVTMAMAKTVMDIFASPLNGSLKKLLVEAKTMELVALQLNSISASAIGGKKRNHMRDLMENIRLYLNDAFLEEHTLKSICLKFGVNEFALKNRFKEYFNTTVFDFILSRRLEHARDLLQNTDQTIQEVSTRVGYKYPNHFSTAFKNKFGITPGSLSSN
jgi:AraC family transcriptional regulator, transcriptional activator of the genes for pyochelin and ferripyochelin receptors